MRPEQLKPPRQQWTATRLPSRLLSNARLTLVPNTVKSCMFFAFVMLVHTFHLVRSTYAIDHGVRLDIDCIIKKTADSESIDLGNAQQQRTKGPVRWGMNA